MGDAAVILGDGDGALVTGGGSIAVFVGVCLDAITGSGKAGMSASDAVSIVICFGGAAGACLSV
jgi:hypothetical protein